MDIRERLSKLIKNIRQKRKMSAAELADKAGVHIMTIYRLEEGTSIPRVDTLDLIFKALDYKYIIGGHFNNDCTR